MTVAFFEFEDVLARRDRTPIPQGLTLLRLLRPGYRIALSSHATKPELVEHWLLENGVPKGTVAYRHCRGPTEEGMAEDEVFMGHLDLVLSHGAVELVVTASPSRAARVMNQRSITVLLFGNPATARPEFRPGMRSWEEIEEEVGRRRILRTTTKEDNHASEGI